jgi:hypothetical protein
MLRKIKTWLRIGVLTAFPRGMTPDPSADFGLLSLSAAVNLAAEVLSAITTAGTNTTLTVAQLLAGVTVLNAGWSGGATITLPATAAIIGGLPPGTPTDGSFAMPVSFLNNGTAQTGTVTAGDASTTIVGTATVATNTRRAFLLTVLSPSTISLQNLGSVGL